MAENTTSTQDTNKDNLMDMLNDFNVPPESSEEVKVENEIESNTEESVELSEEKSEEITQKEEETVEEVKNWLIDNKFEDSKEGKKKLADAYKNIQSAKDKAEVELRDKSTKYEKLEIIDDWLKKNPNVVEKLQQEAEKQEASGPPQKPEEYDILEEAAEGSSSQVWRQEIQSFYGFMKSPDNVTTSNMVKVWKVLNEEKENANSPSEKKKENSTSVLEMEKVQSGAAIEGKSTPAKKPEDKELDGFMKGIMQFSK